MRAIIVGPHPGSTTGFVRVSVSVARQLQARGWAVDYLVVDEPGVGRAPDDLATTGLASADELLAWFGGRDADPALPTQVLCFGNTWEENGTLDALVAVRAELGLEISAYLAIDNGPAPQTARSFGDRCDRLIPSSGFGKAVLAEHVVADDPIPHGVDVDLFRPLEPAARDATRRALFGSDVDDQLIVSYFGRNSGHKRPDLALRAFAHAALGAGAQCDRCGAVTVDELDPNGLLSVRPDRCRTCGNADIQRLEPRTMTMYLHTDVRSRIAWRTGRGWDLPLLVERFDIGDLVQFAELERFDAGHDEDDLVSAMAACDVHLMLSDGAGWELTVLETGACGVPNIVTDHAAPPEYAAPFSVLVPPSHHHVDGRGIRAIADLDVAVGALIDLHDDEDRRLALGARGPEAAEQYSWDRVGEMWHQRLLGIEAA